MIEKIVMLMVRTDNPEIMARAAESMGRAAAGMAMEDVPVMLMFNDATDYDNMGGGSDGTGP